MRRLTISMPEDVANLVQREARRLGSSVSEVIRKALDEHYAPAGKRKVPFKALGRSGKKDTARRAEEILSREWAHARHR